MGFIELENSTKTFKDLLANGTLNRQGKMFMKEVPFTSTFSRLTVKLIKLRQKSRES